MIKGKLHGSPGEGLVPAYSASGQDVWADVSTGEGDAIIVSAVGARCGKAFLASGKWAAIANTHVVWPEAIGVNATFLWYRLNDEHFWARGGTAQPFVLVRKSLEREFYMPPLAEQERIVEKLEALLSRVAAGEAAARGALERLKRYRAAVLHAAVTGELTRDWRKVHKPHETGAQLLKRLLQERREIWETAELRRLRAARKRPKDEKWKKRYPDAALPHFAGLHSLPKSWTWMSVSQGAIERIKNGISVKGKDTPPGIAALKLNAMDDRGFDYSQVRYLPLSPKTVEDLWIQEGDFFVSRGSGTLRLVGRGTLARETPNKVIFPDTMIRVRLSEVTPLRMWIATIWPSSLLRKQVEDHSGDLQNIAGGPRELCCPSPTTPRAGATRS